MLEKTPGRILEVLWSSVTPMLLTICLLVGLLFQPSPTFRDYEYSMPARIIAEAVAFVGLTFVPSYAYTVLAANAFKLEVMKAHASRWRPADPQFAREYKNRLVARGLIVRQHRHEAVVQRRGHSRAHGRLRRAHRQTHRLGTAPWGATAAPAPK
ncbi:uncharacterized protein LOC144108488 [Amblyomma americanum]